jgi:predicted Zn-ribbon and HTH transcriptional regulator
MTCDEWVGVYTPEDHAKADNHVFYKIIEMFFCTCYDCGHEFYAPEGMCCPVCGSDRIKDEPAPDIVVKIYANSGEGEIA